MRRPFYIQCLKSILPVFCNLLNKSNGLLRGAFKCVSIMKTRYKALGWRIGHYRGLEMEERIVSGLFPIFSIIPSLSDLPKNQSIRDPVIRVSDLTITAPSIFTEETFGELDFYLFVPNKAKDIEPKAAGLAIILMDNDSLAQVAYEFAKASTQAIELTIVAAIKKPKSGYDIEIINELVSFLRSKYSIAETKIWSVGEGAGAPACIALNRAYPSAFASVAVNIDVEAFEGPWLATKPVLPGSDYKVVDVPKWTVTKQMERTINWTKKHPDYITVTASSNQQDAILATDKDYCGPTAWKATEPGPSWISIDFGEPLYITRWAVLATEVNDNYALEYSDNGVNWSGLDAISSNKNARIDRFVRRGVLAQYYRLSSTNPMSIREFEVYGDHCSFDAFGYRLYNGRNGSYLHFRIFKPNRAYYRNDTKVPLVVFLHGAGQRGHYNNAQLGITTGEGATNIAYDWWQKKHPCYIIAIQCPLEEAHFFEQIAANEVDIIKQVIAEFPDIDKDRVYVTGLSLGGFGTYKLIVDYSDIFAAAVPLAGGGFDNGKGPTDPDNYISRVSNIKNMPIWAFHSEDDDLVSIKLGISMVEAIKAIGNTNIRFTVYPKGTFGFTPHYCWLFAYYDWDMWEWLFAQNRKFWAK